MTLRSGRRGADPPPDETEGPPADPVGVAREIALRQLTSRARTKEELRRSLARRHVPDEAADEVVERFQEVGLLDDAAYARDWVASAGRRLRSRRVLGQELAGKGVDREVIDEAMAEVTLEDEYSVALRIAQRRVPGLEGLERSTAYRRLAGALGRRGFDTQVVSRVVREVLTEAAHGDDPPWEDPE